MVWSQACFGKGGGNQVVEAGAEGVFWHCKPLTPPTPRVAMCSPAFCHPINHLWSKLSVALMSHPLRVSLCALALKTFSWWKETSSVAYFWQKKPWKCCFKMLFSDLRKRRKEGWDTYKNAFNSAPLNVFQPKIANTCTYPPPSMVRLQRHGEWIDGYWASNPTSPAEIAAGKPQRLDEIHEFRKLSHCFSHAWFFLFWGKNFVTELTNPHLY